MNAEQSLNKSCGLLGMATMTFGSVSVLNCLMTIMGAITCCKGEKKCSKPLCKEEDASFKASFFLMIIAMLHHFMFWKYLKQHQQEAFKESEVDHTTYTSVEMPVRGVPASLV
ncbi:hypothetical protein PR003_g13166 [Phytophthora rubi]|uniref:Uncharacterized protein n=1 Tax=Phytophthora rubi TaxID=129364 RepID=A0A6A4F794_9STRA|nr:hypothetical protein PR002_g12472 [Phytophthora rubi]KAE9335142.1 hypothetical protein PR003_g13166 [Phytophthora rubi]